METNTKEEITSIDLDWQVGSKTPPRVCLCCGFPFDDQKRKMMGPYQDAPYIWVCRDCHSRDYLHFPDKEQSQLDLKTVAINMKKSLKSVRNENALDQRLPLVQEPTVGTRFPGIVNSEGKEVEISLRYIPLIDLKLDRNNVRFRHVGIDLSEEQIEALIWQDVSTPSLYRDIQNTKRIIEPLFIDSANVVIEGNRRLVCLRRVAREIRNDVLKNIPLKFIDPVPCRVFPSEISNSDKDAFLARIHVGGKKPWRTLDQASMLHELYHTHGKDLDLLSDMTYLTKKEVLDSIRAYELTSQYHRIHRRDTEWVSKYSYFFELVKKPALTKWLKDKRNLRKVMRWIAIGQIEKGDEIRRIPAVLQNRAALLQMNKGKKLKEAISAKSRDKAKPINKSNLSQKSQQLKMDFFLGIAQELIEKQKKNSTSITSADISKLERLRTEINAILETAKKKKT